MNATDKALYEFLSAVKRNDLANVVLLGEAHQTSIKFGYVAPDPHPAAHRPLLLTERGFQMEAGLADLYPQWHVGFASIEGPRRLLTRFKGREPFYTSKPERAKVFSLVEAREARDKAARWMHVRHGIYGA